MASLTALLPLAAETAALVGEVRRSLVVVRSRHGHGSGVVWDAGGLIVTNHHVVPRERADVELADGTRVAAEVVMRDTENDVALLRLRADPLLPRDLCPASLGDSLSLAVGELVLAVGHPHGVCGTATLGIVSGRGNGIWRGGARRELLQADVVLAPGSSGGPLADTAGRVVGIASMIMRPGIALAVPVHVVQRFVRQAAARERLAA